jgi:hypothetical protein
LIHFDILFYRQYKDLKCVFITPKSSLHSKKILLYITDMAKLPKELTKVTPLSRLLAGALFVFLPLIAFAFGMRYQQYLNSEISYRNQQALSNPVAMNAVMPSPKPAFETKETPADWKSYKTPKGDVMFKYPPTLVVQTIKQASPDADLVIGLYDKAAKVQQMTADKEGNEVAIVYVNKKDLKMDEKKMSMMNEMKVYSTEDMTSIMSGSTTATFMFKKEGKMYMNEMLSSVTIGGKSPMMMEQKPTGEASKSAK